MRLKVLLLASVLFALANCKHDNETFGNIQDVGGDSAANQSIANGTLREKRIVGIYTATAYAAINRFMGRQVILNTDSGTVGLQYNVERLIPSQQAWIPYADELKNILRSYVQNASGSEAKVLIAASPDVERLRSEQRIPLYRGLKKFEGRAFERLKTKGNLIINRDFMSTSESLDTAIHFALSDANSENPHDNPDAAVILEVDALTGTSIDKISLSAGEKEWILNPGKVFKVVEVGTITKKYMTARYDEATGGSTEVEIEGTFPMIRLSELDQEQLFANSAGEDMQKLKAEIAELNRNRTGIDFVPGNYAPADLAEVNCTASTTQDTAECIAEQICMFQKDNSSIPSTSLEGELFELCMDPTRAKIAENCEENTRCIETFVNKVGDLFDWNGRKFVANSVGTPDQPGGAIDLLKPVYGAVLASSKKKSDMEEFLTKNKTCLGVHYGIYDARTFDQITAEYFAVLAPTNSKIDAKKWVDEAKACDGRTLGEGYVKLVKN
jgi:hypothetical protein